MYILVKSTQWLITFKKIGNTGAIPGEVIYQV